MAFGTVLFARDLSDSRVLIQVVIRAFASSVVRTEVAQVFHPIFLSISIACEKSVVTFA